MNVTQPAASASAVPASVQQMLPKWFADRPATTEALWATGVSLVHVAGVVGGVVLGDAMAAGQADTPQHVVAYFGAHWFGALIGFIVGGGIAGHRGRTAYVKASSPSAASSGKE